jgi:hypothetical protein
VQFLAELGGAALFELADGSWNKHIYELDSGVWTGKTPSGGPWDNIQYDLELNGKGYLHLFDINTSQYHVLAICVPLSNVEIQGPPEGKIGQTIAFAALITPSDASAPIIYNWQATGQAPVSLSDSAGQTVTFTWKTSGVKTITVLAEGPDDQQVSDTHTINITGSIIYLPFVIRDQH